MASKSLSVTEYSRMILERYLNQQYDEEHDQNLNVAAEELYVLLRKLRQAAGDKSEDTKAPLKAIRAALEESWHVSEHASGVLPGGTESLFKLLEKVEELCEERIERGSEAEHAVQIQNQLRYRLTRLVAGDAWDSKPALKLRVLRIMFEAMVRENTALQAHTGGFGQGGQPSLKVSRSRSFGKGRGAAVQHAPHSKWQDSIDELAKMQGSKLLPLLKLLLMENMRLAAAAPAPSSAPGASSALADQEGGVAAPQQGAAAGRAAGGEALTPLQMGRASPAGAGLVPAGASKQDSLPEPVPPSRQVLDLDDLLGLTAYDSLPAADPSGIPPSPQQPEPRMDDPFAGLAEGRRGAEGEHGAAPWPAFHTEGVQTQLRGMAISASPPVGIPARQEQPPVTPPQPTFLLAGLPNAEQAGSYPPYTPHPPQGSPHYSASASLGQIRALGGGTPPSTHPAHPGLAGFSTPLPAVAGGVGWGAGGSDVGVAAPLPQGTTGGAAAGGLAGGSGNHTLAPSTVWETGFDVSFDASSPYFAKSKPFEITHFEELSPMRKPHRPPPPPPTPGTAQHGSRDP